MTYSPDGNRPNHDENSSSLKPISSHLRKVLWNDEQGTVWALPLTDFKEAGKPTIEEASAYLATREYVTNLNSISADYRNLFIAGTLMVKTLHNAGLIIEKVMHMAEQAGNDQLGFVLQEHFSAIATAIRVAEEGNKIFPEFNK